MLNDLSNGTYVMRISDDDPSIAFPPGSGFRQDGKLFVIISAEGGLALHQTEVTPAMIEAGIKAHMECDPTVHGYHFEARIVMAIYAAMVLASGN